jgi:cell division protein FtsQ
VSRWDALRDRRAWRGMLVVMLTLAVLSMPWWAPRLLARVAFFDVRHLQVVGTTLLDPAEVAAMMAIDTTRSVWEDHTGIAARLTEHPQIAAARIRKRLPNTLVVDVTEEAPVAFLATARGLRALDARGDTLPLDPLRSSVSLPIVGRADTVVLRMLAALREESPALYRRISEVRRAGEDELVLVMPPIRVRTSSDLSSARLADILPVERDLARREARAVELDLRFRDQVVARVQ